MMYFYPRVSPEFSDMESENGGPSLEEEVSFLKPWFWGYMIIFGA